jgi:5-dehydro-2-deoxygluconokinase
VKEFELVIPRLDVITIGRCSVDLYGQQIGGPLEDVSTFRKAVGGCPANIAIGVARLGLKVGFISRVGDEQMGRFILAELEREGVDTVGVRVDRERLTALVILGVRDDKSFPMIFVRENCADAALEEHDIDDDFVASASAIVVTGTHLAKPNTDAAQRKAIRIAKSHGRRVVFDVDYRPNLWGLAGHSAGAERYIRSDTVTAHLQAILGDCDLIVGTDEEIRILGGSEFTLEALGKIRTLSPATIVLKRGPMGCTVFAEAIPACIEDGISGPGFPVEVYNVLGAGDAFMSGFLSGWLRSEPLERCCSYANACGAIAVSRLMCSAEYPTSAELAHFLEHGSAHGALRKDLGLSHIHHATTRRPTAAHLRILAIDHGGQSLESVARELGADPMRIPHCNRLAVEAVAEMAVRRPGFGVFLDGELDRDALFRAADLDLWIARRFPHGRPDALALNPLEWPVTQIVRVVANARGDGRTSIGAQLAEIQRVAALCLAQGRELLIEALPPGEQSISNFLATLYEIGVKPDWWLIEALRDQEGWRGAADTVATHDSYCRGFIVASPSGEDQDDLAHTAVHPMVKGFVAGGALFRPAIGDWLSGRTNDATARRAIARTFGERVEAWDRAVGSRAPGARAQPLNAQAQGQRE